MPQRIKRFASPEAQGDDSWVEFRLPTRGEARQLAESNDETWGGAVLRYLAGWNWVDYEGNPLPLPGPRGNFDAYTETEIGFLVETIRSLFGLVPQERLKN